MVTYKPRTHQVYLPPEVFWHRNKCSGERCGIYKACVVLLFQLVQRSRPTQRDGQLRVIYRTRLLRQRFFVVYAMEASNELYAATKPMPQAIEKTGADSG